MDTNRRTSRILEPVRLLLLLLVFGVAYTQSPLYTSNQNAYFMRGLASLGVGQLQQDWVAHTADTVPVFTALVVFTLKYLHPYAFYLYYLIIIGIYAYSILGIASETFNFGRSTSEYLVLWLLIAVIHSAAFKGIGSLLLGINRGWTLETGLAGQHLLGLVFQPSVFGVFLVVSIYTFLRGRPFLAVVFLSIASLLHSTYLLCAAILTLAYMLCILREGRNIRKAIAVGALALSLVLPIVIYVYISFPVATPAIHARFESIFVDWGIPFHARPSYWFDAFSALQVAIVIIALYLLRKTRIFTLLAVSFLVGLALSVVQIITGNKTLALMFPWRVSTYLVPISSCLIIAWLVSLACERWATWIHSHRKLVKLAIAATALALFISGLFITYIKFKTAATSGEVAMMNFVLAHRQVGDVYLIPPNMDRFRIYTGTPVIADMKTHPYQDVQGLEWYARIQLVQQFYQARDQAACKVLKQAASQYGVNHVIVDSAAPALACDVQKIYQDAQYTVYKLTTHP